jgi:hypothetical protein
LKKQITILLTFYLYCGIAIAQKPQFSLSTDASLLHSFKKGQRYWALGQTITVHCNFTSKEGLYVWFSYYSNGKFTNQLTAYAKDTATMPQRLSYSNDAKLRFSHVSIGWKHYLKGAYNAEEKWNLYGYAGFGLLFGVAENIHSVSIDTAAYLLPVLRGKGNFKRLTLDLGLGYELPVGGDVFFKRQCSVEWLFQFGSQDSFLVIRQRLLLEVLITTNKFLSYKCKIN